MGATAAGVTFLPGARELLGSVAPEGGVETADAATLPDIAVASGRSLNGSHVARITRVALDSLGGIGRFVHNGDWVVVKPNIYGPRTPVQACTTNPTVVATVVREALDAGARKVSVMDHPCGGDARESYRQTGIEAAVEKAGGTVVLMSESRFKEYSIPKGASITSWRVYRDIMECDTLIDVPIAKHHGSTRVTMACKGLIGCCQDMGGLHDTNRGLSVNIPDLVRLIRPDLTVVDGTRVRVANGPGGTDLESVRRRYTVLASADPVAADAWAAQHLLGIPPDEVPHLKNAAVLELGRIDLDALRVGRVRL